MYASTGSTRHAALRARERDHPGRRGRGPVIESGSRSSVVRALSREPVWIAFGGLLAAGVAVRVYAMVVYSPAVLTGNAHDGASYIRAAHRGLYYGDQEPLGYPLFLRVVHAASHQFAFTTSVQHALGLLTGVLVFMIVRRLAGPVWLGLIPAAAVWFGGDQLFLEHAPLSEALFTFLVAATLYAAIRCLEPGWRWPAVASALSVALLAVRSVALPLPIVVLAWLAAARRRTGLPVRRAVAAALAATIFVGGAYGTLRDHVSGHWTLLVEGSGWVLYARAAEFADCRQFTPPGGTAVLCDRTPQSRRQGSQYYLYHGGPGHAAFGGPASHNATMRRFALAAIVHQPLDYLTLAGTDLVRYAVPDFGRVRSDDFVGPDAVSFPSGTPVLDPETRREASAYYGPVRPQRNGAAAGLRSYQSVLRVSGWELLVLLVIAIVGVFMAQGRVRWGLILLLVVGVELVLMPVLTHAEWRFAVPAVGPVVAAGTVGAWLLARRLRGGTEP